MKNLKYTGMVIFLIGLAIFTAIPFLGNVKMTEQIMVENLSEHDLNFLGDDLRENIIDKEFGSAFSFSREYIGVFNKVNEELKANEDWDNVMWTKPSDFALEMVQASSKNSLVAQNKWLFLFLTFGISILGALMYIIVDLRLKGPPGIKNDGIYHDSATNRGWIGILTGIWLVSFYIILYFHAYIFADLISMMDTIKGMFIEGAAASKWFLYGVLYCVAMIVMGIRMYIK